MIHLTMYTTLLIKRSPDNKLDVTTIHSCGSFDCDSDDDVQAEDYDGWEDLFQWQTRRYARLGVEPKLYIGDYGHEITLQKLGIIIEELPALLTVWCPYKFTNRKSVSDVELRRIRSRRK